MMSINEVAKLSGLSVRTLHYYDETGLLKPDGLTPAGYRLYGDRSLSRLQEILFFRELEFPLKQIAAILDSPSYERERALRAHITLLELRRTRLDAIIRLAERNLKGENDMSIKEFDQSEIEQTRKKYAAEAEARWGDTAAYRQSEQKAKGYTKQDWARIQAEADGIFDAFASLRHADPGCAEAQALVERWRAHISANYYECTLPILKGLGEMYTADARFKANIDAHGKGTAAFMGAAIARYCEAE